MRISETFNENEFYCVWSTLITCEKEEPSILLLLKVEDLERSHTDESTDVCFGQIVVVLICRIIHKMAFLVEYFMLSNRGLQ